MRCVSWGRRGAWAVRGEGGTRPRGTASLLGSAWDLGSDTLLWQALSAGFVFYSFIHLSICPSIPPSSIHPSVHFTGPPTSSCPQGAPAWSSPRIQESSVQSCMVLSLCPCNHTHFWTPAQPVTARTVPGPACLFTTGFFPPVHPSLCLWSKSLLPSETLMCACPPCPFLQEMDLRLCTASLAFPQPPAFLLCLAPAFPLLLSQPSLSLCLSRLASDSPSKSSSMLPLSGSPSGFLGPSRQGRSRSASLKALVTLPHCSGLGDVRGEVIPPLGAHIGPPT